MVAALLCEIREGHSRLWQYSGHTARGAKPQVTPFYLRHTVSTDRNLHILLTKYGTINLVGDSFSSLLAQIL